MKNGLVLVIGMCMLHNDLSSIRQEARQHMAQLAWELHVIAVAMLGYKDGFPSWHVHLLSAQYSYRSLQQI